GCWPAPWPGCLPARLRTSSPAFAPWSTWPPPHQKPALTHEEDPDDHDSRLRELRDAHRDRALLRLLHRRERCAPVVRRALRADDRVAGTAPSRRDPAGDRAADARLHGHHACLAEPPARHREPVLTGVSLAS